MSERLLSSTASMADDYFEEVVQNHLEQSMTTMSGRGDDMTNMDEESIAGGGVLNSKGITGVAGGEVENSNVTGMLLSEESNAPISETTPITGGAGGKVKGSTVIGKQVIEKDNTTDYKDSDIKMRTPKAVGTTGVSKGEIDRSTVIWENIERVGNLQKIHNSSIDTEEGVPASPLSVSQIFGGGSNVTTGLSGTPMAGVRVGKVKNSSVIEKQLVEKNNMIDIKNSTIRTNISSRTPEATEAVGVEVGEVDGSTVIKENIKREGNVEKIHGSTIDNGGRPARHSVAPPTSGTLIVGDGSGSATDEKDIDRAKRQSPQTAARGNSKDECSTHSDEEMDEKDPTLNEILQQQTKVTLNIGGKMFQLAVSTMKRAEGSLFQRMVKKKRLMDQEEIFIDRDSQVFHHIVSYLRHGEVGIADIQEEKLLVREAKFYRLPGLVGKFEYRLSFSVDEDDDNEVDD